MSELRVPLSDLSEGDRVLPAEVARYVTRVHRLGLSDRFLAFDPEARLESEAEIVDVTREVRVRLAAPRAATLVAERSVCVLQAIGKGTKLDAVARDATELGATRLVPVVAERSVKRRTDIARLRRVALEAARQCGRGDVLAIDEPRAFVEALAAVEGSCLLLHPSGPASLGAILTELDADRPLTIAIGPEGGFSDEELRLAQERGCMLTRLGPFVLRTETACSAALGAVLAYGG
jgi:16S rRNA (uracil1498-N3)-methyltransferase